MPALKPPPRVSSPHSSLPPPAATFRTARSKRSKSQRVQKSQRQRTFESHNAAESRSQAVEKSNRLAVIGCQRVTSCRLSVASGGVPDAHAPGREKSEIINLKSHILPHSPFRLPPWCRLKSPPVGLARQHQRTLFEHEPGPPIRRGRKHVPLRASVPATRRATGCQDPLGPPPPDATGAEPVHLEFRLPRQRRVAGVGHRSVGWHPQGLCRRSPYAQDVTTPGIVYLSILLLPA